MTERTAETRHAEERRATTSPRTYVVTFVALLILLALTYGLDQIDLHGWNNAAAFAIAAAKAALIALFFMHLAGSSSLVRTAAAAGLVWLSIGMSLTLADLLTRGWHDPFTSAVAEDVDPEISDRYSPGPTVRPPAATDFNPAVEQVFPAD